MTAEPVTVRAVLDLGINPSTPDETGLSPLANAAGAGMVANMAVLLEHGVSPDDAGSLGVPPIWMAVANGQTRAVRFLLAAGASTDTAHPVRKSTVLEVARSRRGRTIISLLEKER